MRALYCPYLRLEADMRTLGKILLPLIFALPVTAAASPKLQGSYGDWTAYSRYDGSQRICYVLSKAKTKTPTNVRHGDILFLVASWKSGAATQQPSFMADFSLSKSSTPIAKVGKTEFPMYVSQNESFIAENADEQSLLREMRAGSTMKVSAVSGRGTRVNYTFSLNGISAALDKAAESCR